LVKNDYAKRYKIGTFFATICSGLQPFCVSISYM